MSLSEPYVPPAANVMGPANQDAALTRAYVMGAARALHAQESGLFSSPIHEAVLNAVAEVFMCGACLVQKVVITESAVLRLPLYGMDYIVQLQEVVDATLNRAEVLPLSHVCSTCGQSGVIRHTLLARAAPLVCVQLLRFTAHEKLQNMITGVQSIALAGHILSDAPQQRYSLLATVSHAGEHIRSGHYTASVCTDAGWFICDDTAAAIAGPVAVESDELIAEQASAYLLFYALDGVDDVDDVGM